MQDQVEWDLRSMLCETSAADQVLVFFLLAVLVVVGLKLFKVWRMVRPFSRRLPENALKYTELLKVAGLSLVRWIQFSFLFGGFCIWAIATKIVGRLILAPGSRHLIGWCDFQAISGGVGLILVVTTIAFLARWHLERRLQRCSDTIN